MNVNINEHIFFILPLTSAGDHLDSINFRHMQRELTWVGIPKYA